MDETIREKVAQKESELNATYDERILNYEERLVPSHSFFISYDADLDMNLQRKGSVTSIRLR
jgi:hypothetical protein